MTNQKAHKERTVWAIGKLSRGNINSTWVGPWRKSGIYWSGKKITNQKSRMGGLELACSASGQPQLKKKEKEKKKITNQSI